MPKMTDLENYLLHEAHSVLKAAHSSLVKQSVTSRARNGGSTRKAMNRRLHAVDEALKKMETVMVLYVDTAAVERILRA